MNNLSAAAIKVLNYISFARDRSVSLGTILNDIITSLKTVGTPVNAVNASNILTVSGVVLHGETVTINNPLIPGTNVYEFLADEAQTKSNPTNIAVDITDYAQKATIALTIAAQPTSGDTMTIGSKIYTFVPVGTDTADGEVSIGTDLATAQTAIVEAINGTDGVNDPHPLVSANDFDGSDCILIAFIGGTAGHSIVSTETFTSASNGFLSGGFDGATDCSAANAVTALVAAITASDTQGVGAADGTGDTVDLTADVAGAAGNNIVLGTTMGNGLFENESSTMLGGVNGTVGSVHKIMIDATYLYVCVAENTVSGKNWRRISLGNVY